MGLAGRAAKAAAKKVVKKVNGGCPGSSDGKHNYTSTMMTHEVTKTIVVKKGKNGQPDKTKQVKVTEPTGHRATYCKNRGCGRMP